MNGNYRPLLFSFMTGLFWFSQYTYVPILSPYAQTLGASYKMVGLIIGSYGLTQMILRMPLGIWSDTLRKRKVFIILGVFLSILSCVGVWHFQSLPSLLIFRALSGVSAATWVAFTVLFSSYYINQQVPKAIGILNSVSYTGQVTGMFLGGIVAQSLGPEYTFLVGALGGIGALILSFAVVEKVDISPVPIRLRSLLETTKDFNLLVVSFLAVLSQMLLYSTVLGFTPLVAKEIGASSFQQGILSTLAILPGIFAAPLSGTIFIDKLGEAKTAALGFLIFALYCISIPYIHQVEILYISQFIGGFGRGILFSLLMGLSIKSIPNEKRATAMGFFQSVYSLGMFLGPVLVGLFGDTIGLNGSFIALSGVGLISAWISLRYININTNGSAKISC